MTEPSPAAVPTPRLIVIGASAGGLAPLRDIARAFPADFPATVLVVMHISSTATSVLPDILARAAQLGVAPATDHLELRPGRMLVAPPDRHLTVLDGHVQLQRTPRENGHRPAVDPLFRTAAEQYGPAACGVILSGSRDDGAVGLAQIKAHGGVTIVQDPADAQYDGMPSHALATTDADFVLPADEIGPAIVRLVLGQERVRRPNGSNPVVHSPELLSVLCPECGGSLFQDDEGGVTHYSCHIGHRYSVRSLLAAHADAVERAMWTAVRSLEDRSTLLRRMADRADGAGAAVSAQRFRQQAVTAEEQSEAIRVAVAVLDDQGIEPPSEPNGASS